MAWSEREYQKFLNQQADSAQRQQAGKRARADGERFELALDRVNDAYVAGGLLARWLRQQPRMRAVWRGDELFFKPIEKAPCDYVLIFPSGRLAIFDAKSTSHDRQFSWPAEQTHQLAELRSIDERTRGASPAFTLVEWQNYGELRLHPIRTIDGRTVRRAEGLPVAGHEYLPALRGVWPNV